MGSIINYSCPECGKSWNLHIGQGMLSCDKSEVLKCFGEMKRQVLQQILEMHPFDWRFEHVPGGCQNCKNLVSVPVVHYGRSQPSSAFESYKAQGNCSECGSEKIIFPTSMDKITCPFCGKGILSQREEGLWD
ncbi:MAG: hypothetical protein IJU50_01220 [Lachnospiraceae bacterium]|nr:hypothetical protein [Lachnospiraceae bacterium]